MTFTKAKNIFEALFKEINGYTISLEARRRLMINDRSLTYGEINFESFYQILTRISPKKEETFYDLGSGTGKAVFAAHLLFDFQKAAGIEILEDLYKTSLLIKEKYENQIRPNLNEEKPTGKIEFVLGDFLKTTAFYDADIIFLNSTCFTDEMMADLEKIFNNFKKNLKIITLTKKLKQDCFRLIWSESYLQGWGKATVNFYVFSR